MSYDPESGVFRADPSAAEPSPVPGLCRAEYDELAANLRWFSKLSLADKLAAIRRNQARLRRARGRALEGSDGGRA